MSVSVFPAPVATSGGGGGAPTYYEVGIGAYSLPYVGLAGVYTIKAYSKTLNGTPTGNINFIDNIDNSIGYATFTESDTGNSYDYSQALLRVTGDSVVVVVNLNVDSWVTIEYNEAYKVGTLLTTTTYSTSQNVTLTAPTKGIILGGGGGGGNPRGGTVSQDGAGGGGGSGYFTYVNLNAGTYALVCGAGGGQTVGGGTTTINGLSALGGSAGGNSTSASLGGTGGAGGSRGGNGGNSYATGQTGYANGLGDTGSGVLLPYYVTPGVGGTGRPSGQGVGGGGNLYSGGGGGGGGAGNPAGAGGGGGGAVSPGVWTSTGGSGGLVILNV